MKYSFTMKLLCFILTCFSLPLLFITSPTSATQVENSDSPVMLTPVILTLSISESEKNNPEVIAAMQDRVLESLKPFLIENIKRYRYTPLLALSVDNAGLDMLENSDDISTISNDGLSRPHSNKTTVDPTLQKESPCKRNAK